MRLTESLLTFLVAAGASPFLIRSAIPTEKPSHTVDTVYVKVASPALDYDELARRVIAQMPRRDAAPQTIEGDLIVKGRLSVGGAPEPGTDYAITVRAPNAAGIRLISNEALRTRSAQIHSTATWEHSRSARTAVFALTRTRRAFRILADVPPTTVNAGTRTPDSIRSATCRSSSRMWTRPAPTLHRGRKASCFVCRIGTEIFTSTRIVPASASTSTRAPRFMRLTCSGRCRFADLSSPVVRPWCQRVGDQPHNHVS